MIDLDAAAFAELITTPDVILLDVRTPEEFLESHIPGSLNIDFYGEDFLPDLAALDRSKRYAIYCRSGKRSGDSCQIMAEFGFNDLYNLRGGIIEWVESNMQVTK
jgi:rhodanese-related sulfurtransferase